MKRALVADALLVSLMVDLFVACRSACAIDPKPTDTAQLLTQSGHQQQ
jgi:hypothetical protein